MKLSKEENKLLQEIVEKYRLKVRKRTEEDLIKTIKQYDLLYKLYLNLETEE